MTKTLIIGCGVVGATIAYELSSLPNNDITVIDRNPPAQGCTGAALGVMMGVISQKIKGRAWQMRQGSLRRYDSLIAELEKVCDRAIPYNRQGILLLCNSQKQWQQKQKLVETRRSQGWELQAWSVEQIREHCPHLATENYFGAIYSPQDRQVHPTILTQCLVSAAQQRGVQFHFNEDVQNLHWNDRAITVETLSQNWTSDRLIISAGVGSSFLTQHLPTPLDLRPVLGQAMTYSGETLGDPDFQPVISGGDIHLVPLGAGDYWVGATVEFPNEEGNVTRDPRLFEEVIQSAIAFCPSLEHLTLTEQWSGLRPRPHNQPAPVIQPLPECNNIWLATGHYRNGVLLAPATAEIISAAYNTEQK
ncbi:NAD(P)/FAD-dependent oxidoreductase [Roseofilum casamattae]|uniref:FAD-dependent oxidoreductase n=1 Tax=Roseofilum casamattae BLCC-M143 TaxID=3022442 RepID=A0ABT7BXB2_9CYAN|nr:FAD-dependent oxidoreductase [Roseofilum casamattae]MDJ1183811.1 FAD-dependent oxidoreductase [Roseofilum casamattae BLCC-M143]